MESNKLLKVIIVGSGIAGLTLANCLLDTKIDFIILEKEEIKKEYHGSDFYLCPNGIRILDQLGLWESIKNDGIITEYIDYIDKNNKKWSTIDWKENQERYGYPVLSILRQKLLIKLWANIVKVKGNEDNIMLGKRVVDINEFDDKIVVYCDDNTFYEGDFVVGADGAWSKVRRLMYKNVENLPDSDKKPLNTEYSALFGVSSASPNIHCNGRLEWHIQPNLSYFLHVQPNDEITWFLGERKITNENNKYDKTDIEYIKEKYKYLPTNHNCNFGEILDRSKVCVKVNLEEKMFETWYNNRIVLIGDAAHKLLPYGAQGANQAIEDTVVLTNCLYKYFKETKKSFNQITSVDFNIIFEKYQSIRKPRVKKLIDTSKLSAELVNIPTWYYKMASWLLNNFLPKSIFTKMMDERFNIRPILKFKPIPQIKITNKYVNPLDSEYY